MQGIRPQTLSDNELLRYIYIMGFDKVPPEWIQELVERFTRLLDADL
jgi:hypothetical protein